jgi:hypothetical protein
LRCRPNSTAAASAIPMGIPGCPDFAASTASIDRTRIALARSRIETAAVNSSSLINRDQCGALYWTSQYRITTSRGRCDEYNNITFRLQKCVHRRHTSYLIPSYLRNSFYWLPRRSGAGRISPGRFHGAVCLDPLAKGRDDQRDHYRVGHSRLVETIQCGMLNSVRRCFRHFFS